jgi:GxxExxY protein
MEHRAHGDTETRSRREGFKPVPDALNSRAEKVTGAAIEVHRELGAGFQEATYQRVLMIELELLNTSFASEVPATLRYKERDIGEGRIDLLIDGRLIVELKADPANPKRCRQQVLSYLRATGLRLGLIINFGVEILKDGISRVILD